MKVLLFGAGGQVGWELQRSLSPLGAVQALDHQAGDLEATVVPLINDTRPDIIVNAAAYTAVDKAEVEPERALRINAGAVGEMAQAAASLGALLVHYSTDYVFDGSGVGAYRESDATGPLSVYGRTKLAGEEAIRASGCRHLIFRTSWVYALRGKNFAHTILKRARSQDRLQVVDDTFGVPASAELIADTTALVVHRLLDVPAADQADLCGTYHLVPAGETTWHGYATFLIETARSLGMPIRVAPRCCRILAIRGGLLGELVNKLATVRRGAVSGSWQLRAEA